MRTHVEFTSTAFAAYPDEDEQVNPGRYGKRLSEFLVSEFSGFGFQVRSVVAEDWGWRINLENAAFPLWVGCGNHEDGKNTFLCFVEPSKPVVRRWLKVIDTAETVERLALALDAMLQRRADVVNVRWWTEDEVGR